jgi:hypothetical protein
MPDSASTASPGPQDTQTLIALLGNLMPLLMRLQSQAMPLAPGYGAMAPNPMLDYQAAVNLVEGITADSLRTLSAWLEAHAGRQPGVETCVPIVTQAAHCFAARDYAQAFALIWQAYRAIALLRANNPQLPPLRAASEAFAPPTSVIH